MEDKDIIERRDLKTEEIEAEKQKKKKHAMHTDEYFSFCTLIIIQEF